MTPDIATGAVTALWLGLLTSITPCTLAPNIAAMSFIGKRVGSIPKVLFSGILYTIGLMAAYAVIGMIVVTGLLSVPDVAMFLQRSMNVILGPILAATGVVLVGVFRFTAFGGGVFADMGKRVGSRGSWGAFLLGFLIALTFCPVSAALFFGSIIPLAVRHGSRVLLPCLYGVGTGIPVLLFAVLLAIGAHAVGAAFRRLSQFEFWAQRVTGVVFIIVGVYLGIKHIGGISLPF